MAKRKTGQKRKKARSGYQTYVDWYDRYSRYTVMKDPKYSERVWARFKKDAQEAGISTANFSRTLAMRQRLASELQLKKTWEIVKDRIKQSKILVSSYTDELQEVLKGSKKMSTSQFEEKMIRLETNKAFLENYGKVTWSEFRRNQAEILEFAKETVDDRAEWNEIFELAFDSPKEKSA